MGRQNEPNEGRALKEGLTNAIPETTCRYQKMGPCTYIYTECNRRNGPDFGRVFLRSNYTDITQNTYIQSSIVTEILAREV